MATISNFTIFFIFHIFIFKFFFTNITDFFFHFHMAPAAFLLATSFFCFMKLIISNACSLTDSQNVFVYSLPLYTSCVFSMLLNNDIVDTEKPHGISSRAFVVDEFSGLFLLPSIFSIKHSKSVQIINIAS